VFGREKWYIDNAHGKTALLFEQTYKKSSNFGMSFFFFFIENDIKYHKLLVFLESGTIFFLSIKSTHLKKIKTYSLYVIECTVNYLVYYNGKTLENIS